MTTRNLHFLSLAPIILLIAMPTTAAQPTGSDTAQCPCLFEKDDNLEDCAVYGLLDDELVGWKRADQDCLDAYQIKIDAIDPDLVCSSASSFVNALKNGALSSSNVKLGLGIPYGGFWEEADNPNSAPVLKDSITTDGSTTIDCTQSESSCYNAMKPFFESDPVGQEEMSQVCDQLANQQRSALEQEQSVLRTRLCLEYREASSSPAVIASECADLFSQLEPKLQTYDTLNCGGFGIGPGTRTLPTCTVDGDDTTTTDDPATSQAARRTTTLTGLCRLWLGHVLLLLVSNMVVVHPFLG